MCLNSGNTHHVDDLRQSVLVPEPSLGYEGDVEHHHTGCAACNEERSEEGGADIRDISYVLTRTHLFVMW